MPYQLLIILVYSNLLLTPSIFGLQTWKAVTDRLFYDPHAPETGRRVPTKVPDNVPKRKLQEISATDCTSKQEALAAKRKRKGDRQQETCSTSEQNHGSKGAPPQTRRKETRITQGRSSTSNHEDASEQYDQEDAIEQYHQENAPEQYHQEDASEQYQEIDSLIQELIRKTNALPSINQIAGVKCTVEENNQDKLSRESLLTNLHFL